MNKDIIIPFFDFRILSVYAAEDLVENDPLDKWNVVSLYSPVWDWQGCENREAGKWYCHKPLFPKAKRLCQQKFADIDEETENMILCEKKHIQDILTFSEDCIGESVLVHCHAGISRSTAISFLMILNAIKDKCHNPAEIAMREVVRIRQIAQPNRHIINIGLPLVANNQDKEIEWFRQLYNSGMATFR